MTSQPSGLPIFLGIDVASVNSAVVTSTGVGRQVQPPEAKKAAGATRWCKTMHMANAVFGAVRDLTATLGVPEVDVAYVIGMEDIRFAGGKFYDDPSELKGILKYGYSEIAQVQVIAMQVQTWRSIMSIANGLPTKVRYAVYLERAEALGFTPDPAVFTNAKGREDAVTAFLIAKVTEWAWLTRAGNPPRAETIPFPVNAESLVKLANGKEEWL